MTDSKTSLEAATASIQQAGAAFDSERAAIIAAADTQVAAAKAEADAWRAECARLQAQIDPWSQIDKTGGTDVTEQLRARIDAGDDVPAGLYLVDPTKTLKVTRDGFKMDPNAILIEIPSPSPRDCCLDITGDNLTVTLGRIIGDRMSGAYTAGSTNEWGYGAKITGDNCKVYGLHVSRCTGDGIGVMGKNCELHNCVSTENRRQAVSVFNAPGFKAYDCQFTETGALTIDGKTDAAAPYGPCAGIDFEPDAAPRGQPAPVVDGYLERCVLTGNRAGVLGWLRAEVGGTLMITIVDCDINGNSNGVNTKALAGKVTATIVRSRLTKNTAAAVRAESGSTVNVGSSYAADANTIAGMSPRTAMTKAGIVTKYDLQAVGPTPLPVGKVVAGINNYA